MFGKIAGWGSIAFQESRISLECASLMLATPIYFKVECHGRGQPCMECLHGPKSRKHTLRHR